MIIIIIIPETTQNLKLITDELSETFSNTQPEPINMKWSQGQPVNVKYHQDNKWYRGTILKVCILFLFSKMSFFLIIYFIANIGLVF